MADVTQRAASLGDVEGIWGLMRQVAAAVPFALEDEADQERVLSELMACCTSGLSPIAVGADQTVVGALLVRRDDFDWCLRNGETVHVAYAAVAPDHRYGGVLRALVADVQTRKVPVLASVRSGNTLGLADDLAALGFAPAETLEKGWGDLFLWQPASAA